jgi:hypothetical protein
VWTRNLKRLKYYAALTILLLAQFIKFLITGKIEIFNVSNFFIILDVEEIGRTSNLLTGN